MKKNKPHFVIINNPQKKSYTYSSILTPQILQDVCKSTTGCAEYTYEFDNATDVYNKGRLAKIKYLNKIIYISFSQHGKIIARNSFFQSVTTALTQYYYDDERGKIYYYFLPFEGNIETPYFMFMYRLMITAGIQFLNPNVLQQQIAPFTTIDDMILARDKLRNLRNNNHSTYITKSFDKTNVNIEIYGKTYGANKKETTLICLAISTLSNAKLYEICDQNLCTLPEPDLNAIRSCNNIEIIPTDQRMEKTFLLDNNSLRSPRFTCNLLEKLGAKKCTFCNCSIPELISGAHIWPVSSIKQKTSLNLKKKIEYATDGDNGLWLCENHHKMLDRNLIKIIETGELKYRSNLDEKIIKFIKETTTITKIEEKIIVSNFIKYLKERNKLNPKINYVTL